MKQLGKTQRAAAALGTLAMTRGLQTLLVAASNRAMLEEVIVPAILRASDQARYSRAASALHWPNFTTAKVMTFSSPWRLYGLIVDGAYIEVLGRDKRFYEWFEVLEPAVRPACRDKVHVVYND